MGEYAFGANMRELFENHRSVFERDRIAAWSEHSAIIDWGTFAADAVVSLADWNQRSA